MVTKMCMFWSITYKLAKDEAEHHKVVVTFTRAGFSFPNPATFSPKLQPLSKVKTVPWFILGTTAYA